MMQSQYSKAGIAAIKAKTKITYICPHCIVREFNTYKLSNTVLH